MEEKNLLEQLEDLLQRRDSQHLKLWLEDIHANDVAELIDELDQSKGAVLFRALPKEKAVDVFADLSPEAQAHLINGFSDAEVSHMVEELFTDDAVDMVEELPANVVTRVLQLATPETRNTINHYLQYPEDSAGSIMTSEFRV